MEQPKPVVPFTVSNTGKISVDVRALIKTPEAQAQIEALKKIKNQK